MNRIRELICGHSSVRVEDYGEDYRWVVRCCECSAIEHWTHREVRSSQSAESSEAGPLYGVEEEAADTAV